MKRLMLLLSLALAGSALSPLAQAGEPPGLVEKEIPAAHHGRNMPISIWYPAADGTAEPFAGNPVFEGGLVKRNAAPVAGRHPVVLLSHGMGGTYLSLNWLATGLAERGAIVVAVNHPNGWFKDRDIKTMFNHWTRVQDLQVALDAVLADSTFAGSIDPKRIYAAGYSFGGWTALSLAGVRGNLAGASTYCDHAGARSHNCTDLKRLGVDFASMDAGKWQASYKDPRISAVVSLDPGLTWNLSADDVKDVDQSKLMVIGLGNETERHYATDTTAHGSGFDALVPNAKIKVISPATHFTAMPICTAKGAAILESEKDDPVCTDPPGTNRAAVHDQIIALMAAHFGLAP